jgi:hypothetical protein
MNQNEQQALGEILKLLQALEARQSVMEALLVARIALESIQGKIEAATTKPPQADFDLLDACDKAYTEAHGNFVAMARRAKEAAKARLKEIEDGPSRIILSSS